MPPDFHAFSHAERLQNSTRMREHAVFVCGIVFLELEVSPMMAILVRPVAGSRRGGLK